MRFSIRDVLWLTVVVGLAICWYAASQLAIRSAAERENLAKQLRKSEASLKAIEARYYQTESNLVGLQAAAKSAGIDTKMKPDGHLMITTTDPNLFVSPSPATLNRP